MKINFKQLDTNSEKILKFTYGLYPIELDRTSTWVWTDNLFGGESNDIKSLTIAATSEIENTLLFNGEEMEIQKDCLNIIRLNLENKKQFELKLVNTFTTETDQRKLGIRISNIYVDGEIIF
jgi:hypothetical protein